MTTTAAELRSAMLQGRSATVGAANPYAGKGAQATSWRMGYQAMLREKVATLGARKGA